MLSYHFASARHLGWILAGTPLVTAFALGPTAEIIERYAGWRTVEKAFRAASLPLEVIKERRLYIPYAAEAALIEHAACAIGEANLGLHIGREFPFTDLGAYGRYASMAPNLAGALARAVRGIRYATSSGKFGMTIRDGRVRIGYDSGIQSAHGARHIHTGTLLLIIDLVRQYADERWNPILIELDQPKTGDADDIERLFCAPVRFGSSQPAIVFEGSLLNQPNRYPSRIRDQLTFGDLRQMVRSKPHEDLRFRTEAALRLRLLEGATDIDGTARTLGIGPRTLQRRLHTEGASYRDLVESVRCERAAALLSETSERVVDIAITLGYSSPGHFVRAFRRWTGETPSSFRRGLAA